MTARQPTPQPGDERVHRVSWTIASADSARAAIVCESPLTASCRIAPAEPHLPPLPDVCHAVLSFQGVGEVDSYDGPPSPVQDGPVRVWFDGDEDCWLWRYPSDTTPAP